MQEKPSLLDNLVMMYNIHALREQWDYFTIASTLEKIINLYKKKHKKEPTEITLSKLTGLTRGQIRRCRLLLELPSHFKDLLIDELQKPKSEQRLTEDFFLEMEGSIKTLLRRFPEFKGRVNNIRKTLVHNLRNVTLML